MTELPTERMSAGAPAFPCRAEPKSNLPAKARRAQRDRAALFRRLRNGGMPCDDVLHFAGLECHIP